MPKQQTDYLIQLISSLTRGEKRGFRLFVNRDNTQSEKLFLQLFNHLDKYKAYNESVILKKIPRIKKRQLSNIKRNLYDQLLLSLRNLGRNNDIEMTIQENLDYARILYSKGLYKASLDLLDKAKKIALHHEKSTITMLILELERHIESQHITGSMAGKATEIKEQTDLLLDKIRTHNILSNFSLMLYGFYLQYGYVKDDKDYHLVRNYFEKNHPNVDVKRLGFYDKLLYYQSYVWYYNMVQDFANIYRYAQYWVNEFHEHQEKIKTDAPLYLKGIHNLLNALFMLQRLDKFEPVYQELLSLKSNTSLLISKNNESLWTLFSYIHGINRIYLTADYKEGTYYIKPLEKILVKNMYNWDLHRILVFYYKIACVYFGDDQLDNCITYLNKITNNYYPDFRNDIQCFARILNLIAHFDLGNTILVSYQVKSVYRFLLKMEDLQEVQKEVFRFLRKTPKMTEEDLPEEFKKLKDKLIVLKQDPYEGRPFLYLDIISWLESKIQGIRMQEAIKANINNDV